mmetsp:Transcript_3161/g.5420  ORF Transcript_3161/g.5420 Transcript_3161/m.5420 type:complete len:200 (-) Transcript_3161:417-1016(-)
MVASSSIQRPKLYTSTFSLYFSSYSSGAMNSGVPRTLCGVVRPRQSVARPRSPILMTPLAPFTNMLSHLRSRWMMGGLCPCKYTRPCRICHAQRFSTCSSMCLCFLRYWRSVPLVNSSVMKLTVRFLWSSQESKKVMMFLCLSCFRTRISANKRSRSVGEVTRSFTLTWFQATSSPSSSSKALYTVLKAPRPRMESYLV